MQTRRRFFGLISLAALLWPAARVMAVAPPPAVSPPAGAGKTHLVNGWVLTEADLALLENHAA